MPQFKSAQVFRFTGWYPIPQSASQETVAGNLSWYRRTDSKLLPLFPVLRKTSHEHVTLISSVLQLLWRVDVQGSQTLQCSTTDHTYTRAFCHNPQSWCVVQSLLENHLKLNCSSVKKLHHRKIVHKNMVMYNWQTLKHTLQTF